MGTYLDSVGGESPSALRDAVLAVEYEIVEIVANDKQNPYRSFLYGRSQPQGINAKIPIQGNATGNVIDPMTRFIGSFSQINDAIDNSPLTEQPIATIRRYNRGSYQTEIYNYCFNAGRIMHTRLNIYVEGCIWDSDAARARFVPASTSLSPLPVSVESLWVARSIEFLAQAGKLGDEGRYYSEFARSALARLKNRDLDLPILPTNEATKRPEAN